MYHQQFHSLCDTSIHVIPLNAYELSISYVEELWEDALEFPHKHTKEYEIHYVREGSLNIFIQDELIHLSAENFLFLNKGIIHHVQYEPHKRKKYFVIIFSIHQSLPDAPNTTATSPDTKHLKAFFQHIENHNYFIGKDSNHSDAYIERMHDEFRHKEWGRPFQLNFLYGAYIFSILKNFMLPISTGGNDDNPNLPIAFTKYLHMNYTNPDLSLQDMASHFYMSIRHISRLFKEYFGSSPSKTLTWYRINYAKNYLLETDYSLSTIAEKVGLSSASTLSRLFKELEGITISEYRQLCVYHKEQAPFTSDSE